MGMRSLKVLILLSCQACGAAEPREAEPIKLGLMSSFTGRDESSSQAEKSAMTLAVEEINAAGGLFEGREVVVVTADDEGKPEIAAREARRLIEDEGVVAFVGPVGSAVTQAVLEVSVPAKVPNISCCATSDVLNTAVGQSERERYFFRTIPTDSFQAPILARAARECHACTKLAVFHRDDIYGNPFAEALAREFVAQGGTDIVYDTAYAPSGASYRTEIEAAAATDADCVVMISFVADGSRLRREWDLYAGGRTVNWLASEGILGANFVAMLGKPERAMGLLVTGPIFDPKSPENDNFKLAYRANFDRLPDAWNAQIYDSAALLLLALARAGSVSGPAVRDALFDVSAPGPEASGEVVVRPGAIVDGMAAIARGNDVNYQGASGAVDFEDFGNVRSDYELYRFDDTGVPQSLGLARSNAELPCP